MHLAVPAEHSCEDQASTLNKLLELCSGNKHTLTCGSVEGNGSNRHRALFDTENCAETAKNLESAMESYLVENIAPSFGCTIEGGLFENKMCRTVTVPTVSEMVEAYNNDEFGDCKMTTPSTTATTTWSAELECQSYYGNVYVVPSGTDCEKQLSLVNGSM